MAKFRYEAGTHIIHHPNGGIKIMKIDTELNGITLGTVTSNVVGLIVEDGVVLNNGDELTITGGAKVHTNGAKTTIRVDAANSPYVIQGPVGYGLEITHHQGTISSNVLRLDLAVGTVLRDGEEITASPGAFISLEA